MKMKFKKIISFAIAIIMAFSSVVLFELPIEVDAAGYETAFFPMEYLNISNGYGSTAKTYEHGLKICVDAIGKDTGRDIVYAPFTGYIRNISATSGRVVLESADKVYWADGTLDYMHILMYHSDNIHEFGNLYNGKKVTQGQAFYREGNTYNSRGNHIHLEVGRGRYPGSETRVPNTNVWRLTNQVSPESALFITTATIVKNTGGLKWKTYTNAVIKNLTACDKILETVQNNVIVRSGPGKKFAEVYRIQNIGTEIHATAYGENEYPGHIWYKLDDGNWVYSERVKALSVYSVTYSGKGGTGLPATQKKKKNQSVTISSTYPTKKNCQFVGWSTNSKVSSVYYDADTAAKQVNYLPGAAYTANANLKLYAVWLETKTSVSLSKNSVSLCIDDNKTATIDVTIKGVVQDNYTVSLSSANNIKSSATSISVSTLSKLRTLAHIINNKGEAKITLTAKEKGKSNIYVYIKDNKGKVIATSGISVNVTEKYDITYDAAGGTGAPAKQTKVSGNNTYLSSNVPTKTGYCFMGWSTPTSNGAVVYGPGDAYSIDSDIVLTAVWGADYYIGSELSADGKVLTIYGHGDMPCYGKNNYKNSDWNKKYPNCSKTVEQIKFVPSDGGQITSIGSYAFAYFTKLKSVELPNSISRVCSYAFYNCTNLESVISPVDVVVGSYAYANCTNLSNYSKSNGSKTASAMSIGTVPEDGNGSIGAFAFENCNNLQEIDVSAVSYIGESAFSGCTALASISLPSELTSIEDCAFYNCSNLEYIDIPDSVSEISDGAFSGCSLLEDVEFSENLAVIGEQAFGGCSSIESVSIPETVKTIENSAFANCTSLKNVELPNDMFALSDSMFAGCTSLESIDVPDSVLSLGDGTFFGCSSLEEINIPEMVDVIGDNTFAYCEGLTNVTIPDNVCDIRDFAFFGCSELKTINISENTDRIGMCAFSQCESLETIYFPEKITEIGEAAFAECSGLKNIVFAESMVSIGDEAFAGCSSLENIILPECASYVSNTAFNNCSNTFNVSCYSTSDVHEAVANSGVSFNTVYPVEDIEITSNADVLYKGDTRQLNVEFTPTNASNKNIVWTSQNEDIATVSANGLVTAIGSGVATIVAASKDGNCEAICEVNCFVPVENIEIDDDFSNCYVGTEMYIIPRVTPENPTNIEMRYSTSDDNVATIDENGFLSIVGVGNCIISISSADGFVEKSINISASEYVSVDRVDFELAEVELKVGESTVLNVSVSPSNATNQELIYSSEDENVVTVSPSGEVVAIGPGETTISCWCDDYVAFCNVVVSQNCTFSIQTPSRTEIRHKDGIKLHTNIEGTAPAGSYVVWTTSNGKFKTEEINNGNSLKIVSDSNGKTTFTATLYSADGEVLATDSIEMKSKAGFFDKLGSFFRSLFGTTKTYDA